MNSNELVYLSGSLWRSRKINCICLPGELQIQQNVRYNSSNQQPAQAGRPQALRQGRQTQGKGINELHIPDPWKTICAY